jgi:hypothetical protein
MYDPYLTSESLHHVLKRECSKHGVNFEYFQEKVKNTSPAPVTESQLLKLLDNLLETAFWNDYDNMYAGIQYPDYCLEHKVPAAFLKAA